MRADADSQGFDGGLTTGGRGPQPEDEHESSLDSAVVGVFQAAASGKFLSANLILARMLGSASPADLIAASCGTSKSRSSKNDLTPFTGPLFMLVR